MVNQIEKNCVFSLYLLGRKIRSKAKKHNEDQMLKVAILKLLSQEALSVSELADRLYTQLSSISERVSTMEQRGLVEKVNSKEDKRVTLLTLSPKGEAVLTKIDAGIDAFADNLFESLSQEELTELNGLITRLVKS